MLGGTAGHSPWWPSDGEGLGGGGRLDGGVDQRLKTTREWS
jgi:hypothetical protein